MVRSRHWLAVALLASWACPAPASAESFFLTGRELAGHLELRDTTAAQSGLRAVTVTATLRLFGRGGGDVSFTTQGQLTKDAVGTWTLRSKAGACSLRNGATCTLNGRALRLYAAPDTSHLVVIAVPGLSTNQWNRIGVPYMDENLATLRALGISAYRIGVKTENGIDANAAQIAADIRARAAEGRRVILFAHSKGGADALAAIAKEPSLAKVVAGVVAVQPVFGGSPIADFVKSQRLLAPAVKFVFEKAFGGQMSAVTDLATETRSAFHQRYAYPASVRTVVIRGTFDRRLSKSLLWPNQKLITKFTGAPNDGMVKLADQAVPGSIATLDYQDLDHFEPGLRNESPHTPMALTTRALLVLLGLQR